MHLSKEFYGLGSGVTCYDRIKTKKGSGIGDFYYSYFPQREGGALSP